ncbi:hypothetical protein FHL15_004310 [Xylaria flabelliformis]|uniref:Transcription factor Iwr1 domain-containing protein n=1 Tax=Xylaria flabelliformis TaxID=2512241 RepID=A0A553I3S1_9PEZI|nr:hypothetical protein FHL15_004310 [Xylaria flabelliformis]
MSVPPQLIRVKRKATEEAPVSYLRVQETKRHRSDVFVYQRQNGEIAFAENIPRQIQKPVIHTSPASRQSAAFQSAATRQAKDAAANKGNINDDDHVSRIASSRATASAPASTNALDSTSISEPRRFHMSRKEMLLAASPYADRSHGGMSKKRPATAMFVERNIKRVSSKVPDKLHAANHVSATTVLASTGAPATEAMEIDRPEPRKFKKPGIAKLTAARESKPNDKPQLPKSMTDRWNVDMQQLTADMEAYAMQQIGLNLQRAEEERREQETPRIKTSSQLKFKPKAPAKRYAERHPEKVQTPVDKDMVDADVETSDSDDGDYIIETYVRVPASSMGDHVPPQSVGLLVFDAEPDLEFFYGEDDESEDEWAEDEEDENAENYYTADYPDEEVATDDEFGKNPYAFRTDNASDLEEYDVESDDQFDEEGATSQFRTGAQQTRQLDVSKLESRYSTSQAQVKVLVDLKELNKMLGLTRTLTEGLDSMAFLPPRLEAWFFESL